MRPFSALRHDIVCHTKSRLFIVTRNQQTRHTWDQFRPIVLRKRETFCKVWFQDVLHTYRYVTSSCRRDQGRISSVVIQPENLRQDQIRSCLYYPFKLDMVPFTLRLISRASRVPTAKRQTPASQEGLVEPH